jgi:hypothetical protein
VPCADAAGNQITPDYSAAPPVVCDPTATLDLLGVRATDARNQTFAYDVNENLTLDAIDTSGTSLCDALANIISPPPLPAPPTPLDPQVCASTNVNTGSTACAATHPMAFVLVGRGNDRCLNLENTHASAANDGICVTAVAANRTFENPARIHSRTQDDGYYEDLVFAVTPSELAEAMDCPVGGGGGGGFAWCASGERLVQVNNGDGNSISVRLNLRCYQVASGTTAGPGCQSGGTALQVFSGPNCNNALFGGTVASLDSNNDGRTDILCDQIPLCTSR